MSTAHAYEQNLCSSTRRCTHTGIYAFCTTLYILTDTPWPPQHPYNISTHHRLYTRSHGQSRTLGTLTRRLQHHVRPPLRHAAFSKGVPDRESCTGTWLVSPAVSHEKKWNPLSHVTAPPYSHLGPFQCRNAKD